MGQRRRTPRTTDEREHAVHSGRLPAHQQPPRRSGTNGQPVLSRLQGPACFSVSHSLCDAAPGLCLPFVSLSAVRDQMLCLPQSLRSDAMAPGLFLPLVSLCLRVISLCGRMPDAVTLAPGSCLPQLLRSEARCCDAGSGVVSPTCLPGSSRMLQDPSDCLGRRC